MKVELEALELVALCDRVSGLIATARATDADEALSHGLLDLNHALWKLRWETFVDHEPIDDAAPARPLRTLKENGS
jgi:hypothetical protein